MTDEVKLEVFNALRLGREMRSLQKEYFKTRTQSALQKSKDAERAFDTALDDAAFAVKYGHKKPKQSNLF